MTDNEIIKALEIHINEFDKMGISVDNNRLDKLTLDLIKRQQAENEELRIENQSLRAAANSYKMHYNEAKSEAIKEFTERLKESKKQYEGTLAGMTFTMTELDNLVKEMVGETNDT